MLAATKHFCRDKYLSQKTRVCRDKLTFVATKVLSLQAYFCRASDTDPVCPMSEQELKCVILKSKSTTCSVDLIPTSLTTTSDYRWLVCIGFVLTSTFRLSLVSMGFVSTSTFRLSLVSMGFVLTSTFRLSLMFMGFVLTSTFRLSLVSMGFVLTNVPLDVRNTQQKSSYPSVRTLPGCLGRSPGVDMTTVSWITPQNMRGYQCDDTG